MDKLGEIKIRVSGYKGGEPLSPANYDISYLKQVLDNVENMLFPEDNKLRPVVTYEMQTGSVLHVFKTQLQKVVEFGAVLSIVSATGSLDGLSSNTAKAFENFQRQSRLNGFSYDFSVSEISDLKLQVTPETNIIRSTQVWADSEFYFYGRLTDAGGKNKANIHLDTKDYGLLLISVDKDYLKNIEGNPLYRNFAVRVRGRQNVVTGEKDLSSLQMIDIVHYEPVFDAEYLDGLIKKATPKFRGLDVDKWISEIRGKECYV